MEEVEGASDTRNMAGLNGDRPVSGSKQDASKASSPRSKHSETPQRKGSVGSRSENQRIKAKAEKDSVENSSDANNELSDDSTSTDSSDSDVEETLKPKKAAKKSSKKAKTGRKTSKDRKHSRKHKLKDGEEHDADSDSSSGSGSDEEQKSSADRELQDRIAQIETRVHIANIKNKARLAEIERQAHIAQFENIFRNLSSQSYPTYVPPPQSPSLARREAQSLVTGPSERRPKISNPSSMPFPPEEDFENWPRDPVSPRSYSSKANTSTRSEFKRVDWVWDSTRYTYKLQDTTETNADDKYDGYVFHIRRTFDHEGKYLRTFVDIKSKLLRECLQDVIKAVPGISLVDETPKLDPNMLFLYVEDLRVHRRALKSLEPAGDSRKERKRNQERLDNKRKHLTVLIKYLDKDYADIKSCIEPMLQSGLITYDYLWALWKPGTLIYSHTYGHSQTPRVFKVNTAEKHCSMMKGDFYYIEGKYVEYDGKRFGYGTLFEEIPEFRGAKKITSLPCYPLAYRKDKEKVRDSLIERGKKFVALNGVHFKAYSGMAFMKRKKDVLKFNITNSRVMVDPAIFRRINPNYVISKVKPKHHDVLTTIEDDSDDSDDWHDCDLCDSSDSDGEGCRSKRTKYVTKVFRDQKNKVHMARVPKNSASADEKDEGLGELYEKTKDEEGAADDDTKGDAEEVECVDDKGENGSSRSNSAKDSDKSMVEDQAKPNTTGSSSPEEEVKERPKRQLPSFTDEEYLIASPLVLGFSFADKQWLEFNVARVKDIKWNDNAWDSLVLKPDTKDLIKALVESRKYNAATTIDDVIQGKGKGLVTVLHGPPGTGKTLTAEGISELLKCPLYMASAGELGTDSRFLEQELQKILDICHTWGAILLLDEADVFLEKRNMQDIHRNALVSVFLRQLEYFQGILFLTTNRVETFDEAFQSRIHIALRYDKLDHKAKRAIFKLFIDRVQAHGKLEVQPFTEDDLETLSRHNLNGREIKNVMGSAQDMAINKGEALSMRHVKLVLDVHAKFGRDLKGGTGFEDAMRSYC